MSIIEFKNVSKNYNDTPVIQNFSMKIDAGERVVVLGPSGCGKTTVLRLLAGFTSPDSGEIIINNQIVAAEGKIIKEPEERNLGMVFQDLALWPHLSVKGNLEFGLRAKRVQKIKREKYIPEMLKLMQMEKSIHAKPAELSGGQQQRVALARALILHPEILIMDEPLSSLDQDLNVQLRKEILKLHNKIGFALLYVTHDREEAFDIGSRIIVMKDGKVERIGSSEEIKKHFD